MSLREYKLRRRFNGELYRFLKYNSTKLGAQREAKRMRKNGALIRVIKSSIKGTPSWELWYGGERR